MNTILLLGVSVVYLFVGVNYFMSGNNGLCIAFISYAAANIGLWMAGNV